MNAQRGCAPRSHRSRSRVPLAAESSASMSWQTSAVWRVTAASGQHALLTTRSFACVLTVAGAPKLPNTSAADSSPFCDAADPERRPSDAPTSRINGVTYTGWGSVTHWNAYVAVTQMHGKGTFFDSRLNNPAKFPVAQRTHFYDVRNSPDLVTSKLAALQQ
jgi:hypothetical protein